MKTSIRRKLESQHPEPQEPKSPPVLLESLEDIAWELWLLIELLAPVRRRLPNTASQKLVDYVKDRLIALLPDAKTANSSLAGQTVQQIADAQGKHVIDALLDMVVEDDLETEFYAPTQGRDTAQFTTELVDSNVVVAGVSDGGAHVKFLTAGIYPTDLLTWLVRDEKTVSLEDAHY